MKYQIIFKAQKAIELVGKAFYSILASLDLLTVKEITE